MAKETKKEHNIEKEPVKETLDIKEEKIEEEKVETKKAKIDVDAFIKRKLKIVNDMDNEVLKETIARKLYNNKK